MKLALPPSLTLPALSCVLFIPMFVGTAACGDEAALPPGNAPTSGASTSGGSATNSTGGTGAGMSSTAGTGTTPIGGSGAGMSSTAGSATTSTGGTAAGTSSMAGTGTTAGGGGGGSGSGAGGSSGAGGTAMAGAAGVGSDLAVAAMLDGSMLVGKCLTDSAESVCQTIASGCPAANQQDPALSGVITTDKMITLGGDPAKTYTITLHVQGEVESKGYNGGMDQNSSAQSPKADGFCTGGTPTNGDAYNVYMIRVSSPKQDYFLNSMQPPGVSNHTTYGVDYTAKIQAKGGSMLRLVAADKNCSMIKNCGPTENSGNVCAAPIILQNVDPKAISKNPTFDFTKAFNGQWLVMVVTDVTAN